MTDFQVYFWIQSCALISDLFTVYLILCKALYSYGPMDCVKIDANSGSGKKINQKTNFFHPKIIWTWHVLVYWAQPNIVFLNTSKWELCVRWPGFCQFTYVFIRQLSVPYFTIKRRTMFSFVNYQYRILLSNGGQIRSGCV